LNISRRTLRLQSAWMRVVLFTSSSSLANLILSKAGSLKNTSVFPTAQDRPWAGFGMLSSVARCSRSFCARTLPSSMCFRPDTVVGEAMTL